MIRPHTSHDEHSTSFHDDSGVRAPAWLLIIPGCTLLGMCVGLFLGEPGFGLLGGVGGGFVWWGLILAARPD